MSDWERNREKMVKEQIEGRGIHDARVLQAMLKIPRHQFVSDKYQKQAYDDTPLPIECGQTISQPYMVGLMTEKLALTGTEKVLEIGTGSGYQTALLATLASVVYTIERHETLYLNSKLLFKNMGIQNILSFLGDGTKGLLQYQPYDRIIVTAGAPIIPQHLIKQLADGGIIVIPVGSATHQELIVGTRSGQELKQKKACGCVFVPLIGESGWNKED
ncbi:protein-L-isoaspartate(D-aspartate) O-methyltransferase [candidate division KSB1 bacterium]|nr:protein-L-isoaspartate(D-aspartate) O-methyltransferase [candidate division KSB1 bacterium]